MLGGSTCVRVCAEQGSASLGGAWSWVTVMGEGAQSGPGQKTERDTAAWGWRGGREVPPSY